MTRTGIRAPDGPARFRVVGRLSPFRDDLTRGAVPVGMSIADALELLPDVPPATLLHARLDGVAVPRHLWPVVRPKAGTLLSVAAVPMGLGQIFSSILRVAAVVSMFFGPIGIAVGAVLQAAAFAVDLVLPPQTGVDIPNLASEPAPRSQTLAVAGTRNTADIYGPEPRVFGTHRAVPKLAAAQVSETVGGERWLRAIFALSYGPTAITAMKIGETDLAQFDGVETELRRGYLDWMITERGGWSAASGAYPVPTDFGDRYTVDVAGNTGGVAYAVGDTITYNKLTSPSLPGAWDLNQEKPFKLYPRDIFTEAFGVTLTQPAGWVTRTTQINCDEIAIDLIFPRGLLNFTYTGQKTSVSVYFQIRYAAAGTTNWIETLGYVKTGKSTGTLFGGKRWTVDRSLAPNGQFDVSVRRTTPQHPGNSKDEILSESEWTALRTYTNESPVNRPGMAMLAVRLPPSDLARGILDQFSCVLSSIVQRWNATAQAWEWGVSSNPAALLRAVYQIADEYRRMPDSRIDLDRLAAWSARCDTKRFFANAYIDWATTVGETATNLAAVGRAQRWPRNGTQISVVMDEPKLTHVQHFTPRNTWNYEGDVAWPDQPDAVRVAFPNAAENWRVDERLVFADGQTEATAVDVQRSDIMMVTDADQIHGEARYRMAIVARRRESHAFSVDVEGLVCEPMDWVKLTHDVLDVGLGAGRVASVTVEGGFVTEIGFDETFETDETTSYVVQIRTAANGTLSLPVESVVPGGGGVVPREAVPVASGPAVGDLFAFGIAGRVSEDLMVRSIKPEWDNVVRLTCAPLAPEVHQADGVLPPFTTSVKQPVTAPAPVVLSMQSDSEVMLVGPNNTLQPRVVFVLRDPDQADLSLMIFYRPSGTTQVMTQAAIETRARDRVSIVGVQTGETYDFSLQYSHPSLFASVATRINNYQVVGRDDIPGALEDLELAAVGGQALLRWARVPDIDVQFGGWIEFRWSPVTSGASWSASTLIGDFIPGGERHAWLPLKPGTYLARVFDSGARVSDVASVTTKQSSVLTFVNVDSISEHPTFSGVKQGVVVDDDVLTLDLGGGWDDIADTDAVDNVDAVGISVLITGVYTFAAGYDHGSVARFRLTSHVAGVVVSIFDDIDSRADLIDEWDDFDAVDGAPADAAVFMRSTDDDPAGSPTWTAWTRLDSLEIEARAFDQFQVRITTTNSAYNFEISELRVDIDQVS